MKFLSDRTVCEELMVFDRRSSTLVVFSVQKMLPWLQVWHTISISDPTSMYGSLGKALQGYFWPAGNYNNMIQFDILGNTRICFLAKG